MKKTFKSSLYFLIIILLEIILPHVLVPVYKAVGVKDLRIALFLNHAIIFLIPALIYVIITKDNVKKLFRLNKLYLKDILLIVVIAIASYPLMGCLSAISGLFFENNVGNFMEIISPTSYIGMMLLIAVMPAITEEVTLRGVVLSGYDNQPKFKAALMTGILFGIFHLDPQQFLYAAALGFLLAYVVRVTNSIFASVLMHFIINGISISLQKVITVLNVGITDSAKEISLINLPINEKIRIICVYIILAICFGGLVFKLVKILEKWNNERKVVVIEENFREDNLKGEKIINLPFIATVIIYIGYIIYNIYV